jgi:hypothetical protein
MLVLKLIQALKQACRENKRRQAWQEYFKRGGHWE